VLWPSWSSRIQTPLRSDFRTGAARLLWYSFWKT